MDQATSNVRQGLEALLAETFADSSCAHGYTVAVVSFGQSVDVALAKGEGVLVVWLRPASDDTKYYRKTERFKIGYGGNSSDGQAGAIVDVLSAKIAVWERSLPAGEESRLFESLRVVRSTPTPDQKPTTVLPLEWLAVVAGLKPACRLVVHPEEADLLVEQARSNGLHVQVIEAAGFVANFCSGTVSKNTTILVYAARSQEQVAAAADVERAMIATSGRAQRVTASQVRALGAALGYPPCCIDAFIPIRDRSTVAIRFHALRRTPQRASLLLNDLFGRQALIAHAVCRYDCPPSNQGAQRLLQELGRVDATAADELQRTLGGLVVLFRRGGALRLVLVGAPVARTYRIQTVDAAPGGARFEEWRAALRDADAVDVQDDHVRILKGTEEICLLRTPPNEVQIRLFV